MVVNRQELDRHEDDIVASALADRVLWIAYPRGGQLGTALDWDSFWQHMLSTGVRPVTSISVDDEWTGLRFRASTLVDPRPAAD